VAKSNYENFPVASFFIPKSKRRFLHSIYAFARTADNIADSRYLDPDDKLIKLSYMRNYLEMDSENILKLQDVHFRNVFLALEDTIRSLSINRKEFMSLLTAFEQDAVKNRYDNYDDILKYSESSANPVGHLVLNVFGYDEVKNEKLFTLSDKICTGLQLANFWQDVSLDLKINRIYLPKDLIESFKYSYDELYLRIENDNFKNMMAHLVNETQEMFRIGRELPENLHGRLKYELKAIICGGESVLNMIKEINYKVLSRRVKLSKKGKIGILMKALF
jgi:squalene synthase HpnC